jgi:hypothetical protein
MDAPTFPTSEQLEKRPDGLRLVRLMAQGDGRAATLQDKIDKLRAEQSAWRDLARAATVEFDRLCGHDMDDSDVALDDAIDVARSYDPGFSGWLNRFDAALAELAA